MNKKIPKWITDNYIVTAKELKKCKHCGGVMENCHPCSHYCDEDCKLAAKIEREQEINNIPKTCPICELSFLTTFPKQSFCGLSCAREHHKRRWKELDTPFVVGRLKSMGFLDHQITDDLIVQRRNLIKLNRKINETERKFKSSGNHGRPVNVLERADQP